MGIVGVLLYAIYIGFLAWSTVMGAVVVGMICILETFLIFLCGWLLLDMRAIPYPYGDPACPTQMCSFCADITNSLQSGMYDQGMSTGTMMRDSYARIDSFDIGCFVGVGIVFLVMWRFCRPQMTHSDLKTE